MFSADAFLGINVVETLMLWGRKFDELIAVLERIADALEDAS